MEDFCSDGRIGEPAERQGSQNSGEDRGQWEADNKYRQDGSLAVKAGQSSVGYRTYGDGAESQEGVFSLMTYGDKYIALVET